MEHRENINEWQQIEQLSEWNMVGINENYLEIPDQASSTNDPPNPISSTHQHEHELSLLQTAPKTTVPEAEDGASLTVSSSESNDVTAPLDWRVRVVEEGKKALKVRLEVVRESLVSVASRVGNWAMSGGAFWSFGYVAGAAAASALLVTVVCVIWRRRRRRRLNVVVDRWVCLLREKDEVTV